MAHKTRERKPDVMWFKNKLRESGLQIKDAAEAFGLPPNKVWQMLAARRRVQPEELAAWARLLRVPMSTIFKRMDYPWEPGSVPVEGVVSADGSITWTAADGDGSALQFVAPYPESAGGDLRALVLEATAGGLGRGTVFYFQPYDRIDRAAFNRLSVLTRGAADASCVGVPGEIDEGRADVRALGTGMARRVDRIISATPIMWIRAGL